MIAGAEISRVSPGSRTVRYKAYAKVNLALGVSGKRPDGYHEISTVMAPVQVYDLVSVAIEGWTRAVSRPGAGCVQVSCPALPTLLPCKNLAYKAALAFMEETGTAANVSINIEKRIPAGAGMGGGSSDAAAVLIALNTFVPTGLRLGMERLLEVSLRLGADVPFFLGCNSRPLVWEAALCAGIGEKVKPVEVPETWMVIVVPDSAVETREAYRRWDEIRLSNPWAPSSARNASLAAARRMETFLSKLGSSGPAEIGKSLFNDLEDAVRDSHPVIFEIRRLLLESGALGASMTGSGSAVFGIADSLSSARELAARIQAAASGLGVRETIVTRTGVDPNAT